MKKILTAIALIIGITLGSEGFAASISGAYYVNPAALTPTTSNPVNLTGCNEGTISITEPSAPLCTIPAGGITATQGTQSCQLGGSATSCLYQIPSGNTLLVTGFGTPIPPPSSGTLSAPTNVTATAGSSTSIATLNWAASTDTNVNAGPITYNVLVTPEPTLPPPTGVTVLTASVSGLQAGTTYSISVQAVDQANPKGATSVPVSFAPSTLTAPVVQQPTTGTTPPLPNESVSWSASTDTANPGAIVNYTVTVSPAAGITITPPSPTTATSATISGITIGTPYTVTVTATDPANLTGIASAPVTFTPTNPTPPPPPKPSQVQTHLFNTYGVGVDFNSHYKHNSLNSIYYAFLQYDVQQLGAAGFKTLRMYNVPTQTYINAINAVSAYNTANPTAPIHLIYQVSLCKSDAYNQQADGSNTCIDVEKTGSGWTSVNEIVTGEIAKLQAVITAVTPTVFSNVVSLIIVSNEDLIVSHGFDYSKGNFPVAYCNPTNPVQPCSTNTNPGYQATEKFNDADITNELQTVQSTLLGLHLPKTPPLSADLVVFNPAYADGPTTTAFTNVITNSAHTGPIVMNIYPYQFNVGTDGKGAVNNLSQTNSLKSLVDAMLTTTNPKIQAAVQSKGFMLGETGWPNAGTPYPGEYMTMHPGSITGTQNYINDVITYANNYSIPVMLFEAYDEPKKAGPTDPESHYGLFSWNNNAWITVNQNGISLAAANLDPKGNPTCKLNPSNAFCFDPTQFMLIYPANTPSVLTGNAVAASNSGNTVPFTGPNVAAVKINASGTDTITLTENCLNNNGQSSTMICNIGYSNQTYTLTGNCNNPSLSGISTGSPIASGMLPTINAAIPTAALCTGVAPPSANQVSYLLNVSGGYNGTATASGSGASVTLTNTNGGSFPITLNDTDTLTITYNCKGGGTFSCPLSFNNTTGLSTTDSALCGNMYIAGFNLNQNTLTQLGVGIPATGNPSVCPNG